MQRRDASCDRLQSKLGDELRASAEPTSRASGRGLPSRALGSRWLIRLGSLGMLLYLIWSWESERASKLRHTLVSMHARSKPKEHVGLLKLPKRKERPQDDAQTLALLEKIKARRSDFTFIGRYKVVEISTGIEWERLGDIWVMVDPEDIVAAQQVQEESEKALTKSFGKWEHEQRMKERERKREELMQTLGEDTSESLKKMMQPHDTKEERAGGRTAHAAHRAEGANNRKSPGDKRTKISHHT